MIARSWIFSVSMCIELVVYLINKYWTKMLLLSWCFLCLGFFFFFFLSFSFFLVLVCLVTVFTLQCSYSSSSRLA